MPNKVHHLNNNYEKITNSRHAKIIKMRKKRGVILVSIFLVVILILSYQLINTKMQSSNLASKKARSEVILKNSSEKNKELKQNVKQLYSNDYLEKLIRQKYYYTKPGETVYGLPGDVSRDVTQN
ncbi:septum formation initiator family protein [Apilactobacillus apisilvae]|uniref:Septum formation initiator family protein n=1 Tax=Apilactobacillus apisilvae TaxID=2923364 RepID=A0ABY4PHR1_9LACO|nr:septum formation initiator family protein [Apilactobacillus apisilvae]UQS85011.1 septum formation initiator family protein [Apilactobacillus apisilvae]